jgi:hypothetical protein
MPRNHMKQDHQPIGMMMLRFTMSWKVLRGIGLSKN